MTALSLFDSVFAAAAAAAAAGAPGSPPANPGRLAGVAERLVHALMAELAEIEARDAHLGADPFDPHAAVLLRGMYEQWTRDVDPVLERVGRLGRMGLSVAGAEALANAQGRLFAMLRVTPDDVERGRRQLRQSRTWNREEIRAELGLGA